MAAMSADPLMLSVVIPCLNEAERLPLLLADLQRWPLPIEITVVDGGSNDHSHRISALAGGLGRATAASFCLSTYTNWERGARLCVCVFANVTETSSSRLLLYNV